MTTDPPTPTYLDFELRIARLIQQLDAKQATITRLDHSVTELLGLNERLEHENELLRLNAPKLKGKVTR
jgi:hypothetical protein